MNQITILIVDDDPIINHLLQASLEFEGWKTYPVSTAADAIEFIDKSAPDAAILDLGLPDKDGKEVLRHIARTTPLPVLILSARGSAEEKVICLEMGADDYVTKPFYAREIVVRLKKILNRRSDEEQKSYADDYLQIDLGSRRVTVNDQEVNLTHLEYQLLGKLVLNAGKTLPTGNCSAAYGDRNTYRPRNTCTFI